MKTASIALAMASLIACGCSRGTGDAERSASPGAQAAATDSGRGAAPGAQAAAGETSRGAGDECEDFFRMVGRCIETRIPEPERAAERHNLEADRSLLARSPVSPSAAERSCKANIRSAIRQDRYGCYADEAKKRGVQTACALLSRGELEKIVDAALEDGALVGAACRDRKSVV
jgi:hypothetical protein